MTDQQKLYQEKAETRLAYYHTQDMMKDLVNSLQTETPEFQRLSARLDRLATRWRELNKLLNLSSV